LSGKDRENMIRYAIGYSLEHNPKATAYATQHHKATSTQTKQRNTRQAKPAAKPQATGNGNAGKGSGKVARQNGVTYEKDKDGKIIIPW
jgi:hypothetical protein